MNETIKETMKKVFREVMGLPAEETAEEIAAREIRIKTMEDNCAYWAQFQGLSTRTRNCLVSAEISSIKELTRYSARGLLGTPGVGRKSLRQIQDMLDAMGLSLLHDAKQATKWQLYVAEQLRSAGWVVTPPSDPV